jgi:glycerophosphoryl diester phosphodiesterase
MKIIAHRGASSLAPENTLLSFKRAINIGVDAVEFDVRLTADNQLAVIHDASLERIADDIRTISSLSLNEIQSLKTLSGEPIPSIEDALEICKGTPVIIEGKDEGWAGPLAAVLKEYSDQSLVRVISFNYAELSKFHGLLPDTRVWALVRTKAQDVLHIARALDFDGIDLNFWILNPLTYWLARLRHKEIAVYTVNSLWLAWYMKFFFPGIGLTTDVPQRMQRVRSFPRRRPRP